MAYEGLRVKTVGLMGGTFDPIHLGHLSLAEAAREAFALSQVIFVPAGLPPHKEGMVEASTEDRYLMTVLATMDNPHFAVSRREIDVPGPSYTLDTLRAFREEVDSLYFIMGSDSLQELKSWHAWTKLGDLCQFAVAMRPGHSDQEEYSFMERVPEGLEGKVNFFEAPRLEISAQDIREKIKRKKTVKYLLPESVQQYIIKKGLYRLVRTG